VLGLELDQEVDVAVRPEVAPQRGSEQRDPADAMGAGEHGEEAALDRQAGQQLHTVMVPHMEDGSCRGAAAVRGRQASAARAA